jgi:hypothetical protein
MAVSACPAIPAAAVSTRWAQTNRCIALAREPRRPDVTQARVMFCGFIMPTFAQNWSPPLRKGRGLGGVSRNELESGQLCVRRGKGDTSGWYVFRNLESSEADRLLLHKR